MKKKKDKIKEKIGYPFNMMYLLFVMEIILVLTTFSSGGINFFKNDPGNVAIFISLGLLTFISVFYGFVITEKNEFLKHFNDIIKGYKQRLEIEKELKEEKEKSLSKEFTKEYKEHKKNLKEFEFLVNPLLWFYLSIFILIINLLIILTNGNQTLISILIHLGILTTLFMVTSIGTVYLAFIFNKKQENIIRKYIPNYELKV